jgi:outer membrane protein assembly factor BamB
VVYFGSVGLLCYDHDGSELWQKPIPTPKSLYGMSTSPIAYKDSIIMVLDDERTLPDSKLSLSKIIAVDKKTGKQIWEAPRPLLRSGWSTPMIWDHEEGTDLVVLGHRRLCAYAPSDGTEKWFIDGFSRETIAVPVSGNGHLYASAAMLGGVSDDTPDPEPFWNALLPFDTNKDGKLERSEMTGDFTYPLRPDLPIGHPGFGIPVPKDEAKKNERIDGFLNWVDKDKDGAWTKEELVQHLSFDRGKPNLMAIRPGGNGDISESHISWALHRNIPEIPSPVFHEGHLYLLRDGGVLSAINATDGKTLYRKRLGASGHYSPSPVIAQNHLYIISNNGILSIVPTGADFELAHQHDFKESVNATPAIDASTLYVRTKSKLMAFRGQ